MALQGIVTSDWHLMGMTKVLRTPTELQIQEIHKPYHYAIEHSIEHVFVPGDISDVPKMDDHELIALVTLLLSYDSLGINTYYALGNHDVESVKKTSMDVLRVMAENGMFKRFHLFFQPKVLPIDGVNVAFMPFPHVDVPKSKCGRPPLVFAHIETVGAVGDNGQPLRTKSEGLNRQPGDFIFSGHIHQHQVLKEKRIVFPGSLYQKNFGESLPKGFVEFDAKYRNGELQVRHKFINSHPNFVLQNILIREQADWDKLQADPNIRYKVTVAEGIVVPKGITTDFPNVVYMNGEHRGAALAIAGDPETASSDIRDMPAFSLTTGLKSYLKAAQLEPKQIRRAREFVTEARSQIRS